MGHGSGGFSELQGYFHDDQIVYAVLGQVVADSDGGTTPVAQYYHT